MNEVITTAPVSRSTAVESTNSVIVGLIVMELVLSVYFSLLK